MSSSKIVDLKLVKRRLGWTSVIAGAALAATLAMGNSLVAAVVAVGVVIVLSALIPDRRKRASSADYSSSRAPATLRDFTCLEG
jgi:hypothetical protein